MAVGIQISLWFQFEIPPWGWDVWVGSLSLEHGHLQFHCPQPELAVTVVKIIGIIKYARNVSQDDASKYTLSNLALCHYTYCDHLYALWA